MIPSISLSLALAIDGLDCADYGDAEAAVFVAALSTVLGSSASTTAGDCTSGRRRRDLLQSDSAELAFIVVVSGAAAATTTVTSLAADVTTAVDDGSFASALTEAQTTLSYSGSAISSVTVTGATVATLAPTPCPPDAHAAVSSVSPTGSAFRAHVALNLGGVRAVDRPRDRGRRARERVRPDVLVLVERRRRIRTGKAVRR